MSQRQILKILKEKDRWVETKEIKEELGIKLASINSSLQGLRKVDMVEYRKASDERGNRKYFYKTKER